MRKAADKDVAAGLMFAIFGALGLFLTLDFDFGSVARPGPGFFPMLLSVLLLVFGVGITVTGIVRLGNPIPTIKLRPIAFITVAVLIFGFGVERAGLIPAVFIAALTASFAMPGYGLVPRLVAPLILTAFSAALFAGLLGIPFALWSL